MIPRSSRLLFAVLGCLVLVASACEKAPLLAPTGSSITLTTATNTLSANGSATIVAQVLEAAGTPPHSGTRVTFMTTLGTVDPPEASTDASGRATVTFRSNGANGVAEISASSGGATTSGSSSGGTGSDGTTSRNLTIWIGTAATGRVVISANPAILPTAGGTTSVVANVLDRNGNALTFAPVTFTTTAGSLSASVVNTDASGNASVLLTTTQAATVTATVGVASQGGSTSGGTNGGTTNTANSNLTASVTVPLTSAPVLAITPPGTPPSAGLPAAFTFRVTPASSTGSSNGGSGGGTTTGTVPVRELVVQWGDGTTDNLGAVSGEQTVSHVYRSAGNFTLTATVTDVAGGTARVSTAVAVIPVPRPTIIITPTPQSAPSGTTFQFRIEITAPSGLAITNVVIDFGDGTTQSLGGATGVLPAVPHTYTGAPRTFSVTVTVTDSSGQTTVGSAIVSITI